MVEAVVLLDRIMTSIALGESHFREFKSALEGPSEAKTPRDKKAISRDICEALVGFANADGGELLVGVEDDGQITGVANNARTIDYLLNTWRTGVNSKTPLSGVRSSRAEIDGKTILYFATQKSTAFVHQTSDGKCLQRRDLETIPIAAEEIQYTRAERLSQEYDRQYVQGAQSDVLDLQAVKIVADQISAGMGPEKCLQYLDMADFADGYLRLRRAALLLFAKDPARWHPRLQIRILRVAGTEIKSGAEFNVKEDEYVSGNIVTLIERAWTQLRPHLAQTRLTGSAKFETSVMYPELACREALINAIAHRDYSQEGRGIEIFVFDDRMEVVSPGALLSSLSIDDLRRLDGAHQSRNALICRALREVGYMREVGEGMRRIFELMRSNELAEPEIESSAGVFRVSLTNRALYKPEHLLWLENFSELKLTPEEKAVVVLGYGGRSISPNEIWNSLGIVDTERYRQILASLQGHGVLVSTMSRNQAASIARARRANVRDMPRFRIQVLAHSGPVREPKGPDGGEQSEMSRVFLTNLPVAVQSVEILDFLREHGVAGDLFRRPHWNYGFVQMESEESAIAAIHILNGALFRGYRLVARPAYPHRAVG